jgi:hypothetical protein
MTALRRPSLLLALLLALAAPAFAAEGHLGRKPTVLTLPRPASGEWMGLYLQGKKAGWAFSNVTFAVFDGTPAVKAVSEVALSANIGGAKTERHLREERFYAYKDGGALVGIQIDKTGDGGEEHVRGVRKGNHLDLTITRPGHATETRQIPASAETVDEADAPRMAISRNGAVTGKALDGDDLADKSITTTVLPPGQLVEGGVTIPVRRTQTVDEKDKLPTVTSIAPDGRILELRFGEPAVMVGKAEPKEVAQKLEEVDLFALTRVVLDKAPGPSAFGDAPQLTFDVKGLPKDFQKPSPRQSYLAAEGGITKVTIHGHAPAGHALLPEKATTPDLTEALASTRQVESSDPGIVKKAKEVIGGEKDAWLAARKLSAWVNSTLVKAYGVSSDRATDVLARKEGDCTEHALLFTALSRAVGIPARRVDGLVYMAVQGQPPALYWHEWAEVFVGEWVAIDPTFGEPIADATHLALGAEGRADSAALIGQLQITVE